jgi:translation initiation factor 5B
MKKEAFPEHLYIYIDDFQDEVNVSVTNCENCCSSEELRAPVICIMGHVDTGKTKILDNLRRTHVRDGVADGIVQQIGALYVPLETIHERTKICRKLISRQGDYIVPGLLMIDANANESFKQSYGTLLIDFAILVVDLMHGLERQTIESLKLLTERKTPFIVALNKVNKMNYISLDLKLFSFFDRSIDCIIGKVIIRKMLNLLYKNKVKIQRMNLKNVVII